MVYHVFPAVAYHLSAQIIVSIIQQSKLEHSFIIIGDARYKTHYIPVFEQYPGQRFEYYNSVKEFKEKNRLAKRACILLHARNRDVMLYLLLHLYSNVNFICWGGDFFVKKNLKQRIKFFAKCFFFHRLRSIVVLNDPEYNYFKQVFRIKNLFNIPYAGREDFFYQFKNLYFENALRNVDKNRRVVVYLGNNGARINTYLKLMDDLYHFKDYIEIHCIIQYYITDTALLEELKRKAEKMYGNYCVLHMKTYEYADYIAFMNKCDVYICSHKDGQTGVGAINNCFLLGKKVFINGINYEYIASQGFKAFISDEVKNDTIEELIQYDEKDRLHNYNLILGRYEHINETIQKWENYYRFIQG